MDITDPREQIRELLAIKKAQDEVRVHLHSEVKRLERIVLVLERDRNEIVVDRNDAEEERDEAEIENKKLRRKISEQETHEKILIDYAKNCEAEVEQLTKACTVAKLKLGQLKTITDDCQHMSRFAANKFMEIIDYALSKLEGAK